MDRQETRTPDARCWRCQEGVPDYGLICRECYEEAVYLDCQRGALPEQEMHVVGLTILQRK